MQQVGSRSLDIWGKVRTGDRQITSVLGSARLAEQGARMRTAVSICSRGPPSADVLRRWMQLYSRLPGALHADLPEA